jgi:SAM-dependent methyltransferase
MQSDLITYYSDRAKEYEQIYLIPERQADIEHLSQFLQKTFYEKEVLEIACGTGFWTARISKTAKRILATDINKTVVDIAQGKQYASPIDFLVEDMYSLPAATQFECLFGGFIWSHIKLEELVPFLSAVSKLVKPGGTVVFTDNNYIAGSNIPIAETDEHGNTYQIRSLADGTQHKVLKNFSTEDAIKLALKDFASVVEFISYEYYWVVKYQCGE